MEYVEATLRSLVRIVDSNQLTLGSGFVAHESGLIVTCSHVVQRDTDQRDDNPPPPSVTFMFHLYPHDVHVAQVMYPACWLPYGEGDVAILKFDGQLPEGVEVALLDSPTGLEGTSADAFGYPEDGHTIRYARRIIIGGPTNFDGHQDALQLSNTNDIRPGYSGGPIWDQRGRRVLGILSSIEQADRYGRGAGVAFAIPSTVLRFCDELLIKPLSPYRGLDVFDESDAEFFHGRKTLVSDLVNKLIAEQDFLAILGPSGSGKSSVVRAGLIPALRNQGLLSLDENLRLPIIMTPKDDPVANLTEQLEVTSDDLVEAVEVYIARHHVDRFVLFIDQFEELFNMTPKSISKNFLEMLTNLIQSDIKMTIILTMRDDFDQRVHEFAPPDFSRLFTKNQYRIPSIIDTEEVRSMIVDPVTQPDQDESLFFEEGLIQTIIEDLVRESALQNDQVRSTLLPLLESTLERLWEDRAGSKMTHARYNTIGGIKGSLAEWANTVFDSLDKDRQAIARAIFLQLVTVEAVEHQDGTLPKDTRRPYPLSKLSQSPAHKSHVNTVVYEFTQKRLLVTRKDTTSDDFVVDVIHEVLLREWSRFKKWIDEDRNRIRWIQRVGEKAKHWKDKEGDLMRRRELATFAPDYKKYVGPWKTIFTGKVDSEYAELTRYFRTSILSFLTPFLVAGGIVATLFVGIVVLSILDNQAKIRARSPLIIISDAPINAIEANDTTIEVAPFAIDVSEVSNAQYEECVTWGGCSGRPDSNGTDHDPVTYVNALQAHHFCKWIGRRLPRSTEWSYATLISTAEYRSLITTRQDIPELEEIDGLLNQIGEWSGTVNSNNTDWDGVTTIDLRMLGMGFDSSLPPVEDIITGIGTPPTFAEPIISFRCASTIER